MAKPDGRIEKGQRLSTAISARAWNRAQDAADIVLGVRPGVEAGPLSTLRLPCVKATLKKPGYFGEVVVFDENVSHAGVSETIGATGPATLQSLGNGTEKEKAVVRFSFPDVSTATPDTSEASLLERGLLSPFAICIGNDSTDYAVSGFAITRVRVHYEEHRYARLPRDFGGYFDENANSGSFLANATGCLDSCYWGPARIVGYALWDEPAKAVVFSHSLPGELEWGSGQTLRWALVHF